MTRRAPKLVAGLVLAAVTLGACGGDDDAASATTVASATTPAPSTTGRTISTNVASASSAPATTSGPTSSEAPPTTVAPTETSAPETTVVATTAPETTVAEFATTVPETAAPIPQTIVTTVALPRPVAPPPPRANEAHIEVGTIEIPKIGIVKPMLEGISLNTLDKAPGHWPGTAMPGQPGNVVVAGHRTSKDRPFRHIDQLVAGDEVIFNTADGRFVYTVIDTQIVLPDAMWIVGQTPASTATLFACHPVGSTEERIVVFLQLQA